MGYACNEASTADPEDRSKTRWHRQAHTLSSAVFSLQPYQLDQFGHARLPEPPFSSTGYTLSSGFFASMHIPVI